MVHSHVRFIKLIGKGTP